MLLDVVGCRWLLLDVVGCPNHLMSCRHLVVVLLSQPNVLVTVIVLLSQPNSFMSHRTSKYRQLQPNLDNFNVIFAILPPPVHILSTVLPLNMNPPPRIIGGLQGDKGVWHKWTRCWVMLDDVG